MALNIKQLIIQNKTRQARLRAIKKLVATISVHQSFDYYDDDYDVAFTRGQEDLANKLRKILNDDPFAGRDAYRPGNTDNGNKKAADLAE